MCYTRVQALLGHASLTASNIYDRICSDKVDFDGVQRGHPRALYRSPHRKENAMHTLTISIQGAASDSSSAELPDDQALPVYVKLKEVLGGNRTPKRTGRKESGTSATDGSNGESTKNGSLETRGDVER